MRRRAPASFSTREERDDKPAPRKPRGDDGHRGEKSFEKSFRGAKFGAHAPKAGGKSVETKTRGDRPEPKNARADKKTRMAAPAEKTSAFEGERIAKVMARAGVCSRRDAESWIAEGRVAVNGQTLTSPAVNVLEGDSVTIDGKPMQERERTRLFLFHKPAGLVTSAKDPEGRETVFAYLDAHHPDLPRVVSVGRLDINTEGLLLLTNDGGLARTLELPATGWTRRYRVRAHGEVDQATLDSLEAGVTVEGVTYAPIAAVLERAQGSNAWIAMSLTEGKNREIKRVLEFLGLDVTRLIRVSYGPFQLGELAEGAVEEVRLKVLREQLGKGLAEFAGVDFSSPLRAEPTATEAQEARERAQKRSRKHVSTLRKQRDEKSAKGPRARVERTATADRRGRAVAVERVVAARPKAEGATRNARRFQSLRGDAEEGAERRARPARKEGGARFKRSDERSPRPESRFERKERRERDAAPPKGAPRGESDARRRRFEGGSRPDAARSGAARSGTARPPRAESGARFERSESRPPRAPGSKGADQRLERAPRGERPSRDRNFDRAEPRGGERSTRPPSRGKPRAPRAEGGAKSADGGAKSFDGPRAEGARKAGGRKPGGGFGGGGKPGGARGGPRKPGGGGKPGGPRKPPRGAR